MNNRPHAGVQASKEPFNFRSPSVNPSLNGKEAISCPLLQAFNRHEMPGRVVCAGPHLRCAPHKGAVFALRTQGPTLPCGATANRQVQRHG